MFHQLDWGKRVQFRRSNESFINWIGVNMAILGDQMNVLSSGTGLTWLIRAIQRMFRQLDRGKNRLF